MNPRHLSIVCALLLPAACNHAPGDLASSGAPPMTEVGSGVSRPSQTPVGPVPGAQPAPVRAANPYRGNVAAMVEGRTLFVRMNCSGCHGGRAGGGMGPSLRDVDWIYGSEEAQIFSTIAEGRAHGMPSWGTLLGDDQIWKLVAYISSLRTPQEPNQPSGPAS
jgi:cytochrome c oxidase cbb3-type subunit 3